MGLLIDDSLRKSSVSEPSRNFSHDPNMRQEYQMNHEEQVQPMRLEPDCKQHKN
ncbi:hypothetical protein E4U44_002121 [Claviceps purpurea]|nr:hypothetical protein E4U44_002121 [Claviceps purpurea]